MQEKATFLNSRIYGVFPPHCNISENWMHALIIIGHIFKNVLVICKVIAHLMLCSNRSIRKCRGACGKVVTPGETGRAFSREVADGPFSGFLLTRIVMSKICQPFVCLFYTHASYEFGTC